MEVRGGAGGSVPEAGGVVAGGGVEPPGAGGAAAPGAGDVTAAAWLVETDPDAGGFGPFLPFSKLRRI